MHESDVDDALLSAFDSLVITSTTADAASPLLQPPLHPPASVMADTTSTTGTAETISSNDSLRAPLQLTLRRPGTFSLGTRRGTVSPIPLRIGCGTQGCVLTSAPRAILHLPVYPDPLGPIPDGISLDDASLPPFVVQDFIGVLKTAFLPKDITSRALQKVYAIRQGPAQPLALFMGEFVQWCAYGFVASANQQDGLKFDHP
ncbi:hypothetical protein E4U59_007153 [Claviceps monticola]|nr:hypothetical protein E4U59_007153 [Claviceps monticola]